MIISVSKLLLLCKRLLQSSSISSYSIDAEILLAHCLAESREQLLLDVVDGSVVEISSDQWCTIVNAIDRRISNEPIAYIVGYWEFYNSTFYVNRDVLIPRPETELLVDRAVDYISQLNHQSIKVLDIGTGSGCILLSIVKSCSNIDIHGVGIDISDAALNVARRNCVEMDLEGCVDFVLADYKDYIDNTNDKYDIIVSNPPYVSISEWENLHPGVREYEPKIAVTDMGDGLSYYKNMLRVIEKLMKPHSVLIFEIGIGQIDVMRGILEGIENMEIYSVDYDLQSIARCIIIGKNNGIISNIDRE